MGNRESVADLPGRTIRPPANLLVMEPAPRWLRSSDCQSRSTAEIGNFTNNPVLSEMA
jgi:hypothetical protein